MTCVNEIVCALEVIKDTDRTRYEEKLFTFVMAWSTAATAQTPIPRHGNSCPTGTYKSGDYCKPFKSNSDQVIIEKSGSKGPTGFYKSGSYCKRMS
jgi:hypothetical protein